MDKKRIVVAMSGGVDSSVAAALLQEQGHEVIGITLRLWAPSSWNDGEKFGSCCSPKDIADAKEVCRKLGIAHYTYNLEEKFRETVVDNFVQEYAAGRTPNPCVRCNAFIKFDVLFKYAHALNADHLATGHYARIEKQGEHWVMKKAEDPSKDQSYFLYMLGQKELAKVLFPLGSMKKSEVRQKADAFGLSTACKQDSMDVCFLEGRDYREFLAARMAEGQAAKGTIVSRDGKVLGTHEGLPFYTIGQRERLGFAAGVRMYVLNKNSDTNTLVVGTEEENFSRGCRLSEVSWALGAAPALVRASVKIRSRHPGASGTVTFLDGGEARVNFDVPQASVSPGQSAVFYDGDVVLGGGVISEAL